MFPRIFWVQNILEDLRDPDLKNQILKNPTPETGFLERIVDHLFE